MKLRILGIPKAKQSMKLTRSGIKYIPTDIKREHDSIRSQVISQLEKGFVPLTCGIELSAYFIFPPPKSMRKKELNIIVAGKSVPKTTKPDMDNLLKLLNDALQGVLYLNDSQIFSIQCRKAYGNIPGIEIYCYPVKED